MRHIYEAVGAEEDRPDTVQAFVAGPFSQVTPRGNGLASASERAASFGSFLGEAPTMFDQVTVSFQPRKQEMAAQEMKCDDDMASCTRECERLYGEQVPTHMEPCKVAVVEKFAGGGNSCFPAEASVCERKIGCMRISELRVGDELRTGSGNSFSPVVAFLHTDEQSFVEYMCISHSAGEDLHISPGHILRLLSRSEGARWVHAHLVRPGDMLHSGAGPSMVSQVGTVRKQGAYAPLTASGQLLVEGVLCSCYASPPSLKLSHSICHTAMLPLRILNCVREAVETLSGKDGNQTPLFTLDVVWFLPSSSDTSVHPYAAGLLRLVNAALAFAPKWPALRSVGPR